MKLQNQKATCASLWKALKWVANHFQTKQKKQKNTQSMLTGHRLSKVTCSNAKAKTCVASKTVK